MLPDATLVDERALSKLRWRCRRGLLENDLILERFFDKHSQTLRVQHADALGMLMDLGDNDLLDLLLGRKSLALVALELDSAVIREVVQMLKEPSLKGKQ